MEIVYLTTKKNGKYHGEIERTGEKLSHQSISSEKGITKIIDAFENKIVKGKISKGNLRLYTKEGSIVVIYDYEKIPSNSIYYTLLKGHFPIEVARTIPKATGLQTFKNYLKKNGITIHHANYKKVAAVGLTIAIAISIGYLPVMAIQDQVPSFSATQEKDFTLSKKKLTKNSDNSSTVFNKKSLEQQRQKINYIYQWFQNFNPMVRLDQTSAFQNIEEFSYSEVTLGTKIDRAFLEGFYQSSTYSLFL